jgi:hypothetical protein
MKYITLSLLEILKPASGSDCTLNGISSKHSHATLLVPETLADCMDYLGEPKEIEPERVKENTFILVEKNMGGKPYYSCKPYGEDRWCMMGGNFLYSCGGAFRSITGYPLPIHDRIEP